jgi:hypothetical protein
MIGPAQFLAVDDREAYSTQKDGDLCRSIMYQDTSVTRFSGQAGYRWNSISLLSMACF